MFEKARLYFQYSLMDHNNKVLKSLFSYVSPKKKKRAKLCDSPPPPSFLDLSLYFFSFPIPSISVADLKIVLAAWIVAYKC